MLGLGTIIPIRTGLVLVADEIEKQLGFSVSKFDMIMKFEQDSLDFKVWHPNGETSMHAYPDAMLKDVIKSVAQDKVKNPKETLDYAIIKFDSKEDSENYALIYFRDEQGEKKQIKYPL